MIEIMLIIIKFKFAFTIKFATFAIIVIYSLCLVYCPVFI